jgi:hypothetical protein|tara:strand:+ start:83 stop:559 length:477 start_codon:yes stop_codon:yes gene_type:complete
MKTYLIPAEYGYRNYPYGKYCAFPSVKVEESELITKSYKGFEVSFVKRSRVSNGETYDYILKTINGKEVKDCSYRNVRTYIDSKIESVFKKINGNKQSCLDDVFFTKDKYIKRMQNEPLIETADSLLINGRYNGKQINWCFEYLYNNGMSISELAKFL